VDPEGLAVAAGVCTVLWGRRGAHRALCLKETAKEGLATRVGLEAEKAPTDTILELARHTTGLAPAMRTFKVAILLLIN